MNADVKRQAKMMVKLLAGCTTIAETALAHILNKALDIVAMVWYTDKVTE